MTLRVVNDIARIERPIGAQSPDFAVIWLHGLGATADDFVPAIPYLKLPADLNGVFIFPQAPNRAITINGGMRMPGWYDIKGLTIEDKQDREGIEQSASMVAALTDEVIERGIVSERVILAGFSQGGAVVYHEALRHSKALGGLMALSTYLPFPDDLNRAAHASNADIPILINHGEYDAVVPIAMGQASVQHLCTAGYTPEWHTYPIEHSVSIDQLEALGEWLALLLSAE